MGKNLYRALMMLGAVLFSLAARAQPGSQLSFLSYECAFDDQSNNVQIDSMLMQDGAAAGNAVFSVTHAEDNEAIAAADITQAPISPRTPIRLTLVLDLTDTFPLRQIEDALAPHMSVDLGTEDGVRIIGFGDQVGPLSDYDTDHNRLSNDVLFNLTRQNGANNRLYDAVYEAVSNLDPTSDKLQVILIVTDFRRKPDDQQRSADDIIPLAKSSKTPVFAIGLHTPQDAPDPNELSQIASATGGFTWIYEGTDVSDDTLTSEFESRWNLFVAALNSQVRLTIPASALHPDANTQQETLNLVAALPDGNARTDQISCPIKILSHSIAFSNLPSGELLTEARDVQVVLDSEIDPSRTSVEIWLNNQIAQQGATLTYHLDPAAMTTTTNTLQAQLRDNQTHESLTSTQLLTFTAQRVLQLRAVNENGAQDGLAGVVRFEATAPPDLKGEDVHFILRAVTETREFPLGVMLAPVGDKGVASLTVDDIHAEYKRLFPQGTPDVEALAYIESGSSQRIAVSQPLKITFGTPPAAPVSMPLLAGAVSLVLVLVNVSLLGEVRKQRARRLVEHEDNQPLPQTPMYVTVTHQGDSKTYTLTKKTTEIGRGGTSNQINLTGDTVSRQHGVILWRKRRWYYANRKSRVRSNVNGRRVSGLRLVTLHDLSQIEIGDYTLIFHANKLDRDAAELIKTSF